MTKEEAREVTLALGTFYPQALVRVFDTEGERFGVRAIDESGGYSVSIYSMDGWREFLRPWEPKASPPYVAGLG